MHMLGELDGVGGTARLLLYLVKHSNASLIRHSFVCMRRGQLQPEFERAGALVEVVDSVSPLIIIRGALRFAKRNRVDLVSTHFTRSLICGSAVAGLLGVPLLHNEHGPALETLANRALSGVIGGMLRRKLLRTASAVVCNSNYTARTVAHVYGVGGRQLRVLHLPVERRGAGSDHCDSLQQSLSEDRRPVWVGHIGGMIPSRDQATLIRVIRLLRDQGIDTRLVLIGDGPERSSLEQLTAHLGLREWVDFRGYQSDLAEFFRRIAVYVNPAIAEGFGIAIVEAMLEGIAVVLANAGSHPELIEDGHTGLLYRPQDAQSLAACVAKLAGDAGARTSIGIAGREHALRAFAPQVYALAYRQLAESVLAETALPAAIAEA